MQDNKCPICGSNQLGSYRHIGSKVWCLGCGFTVKPEGHNLVKPADDVSVTREQELEEALKELIKGHFFSKDLEWSYEDGVNLKGVDFNLYVKLCHLLPDIIKEK